VWGTPAAIQEAQATGQIHTRLKLDLSRIITHATGYRLGISAEIIRNIVIDYGEPSSTAGDSSDISKRTFGGAVGHPGLRIYFRYTGW